MRLEMQRDYKSRTFELNFDVNIEAQTKVNKEIVVRSSILEDRKVWLLQSYSVMRENGRKGATKGRHGAEIDCTPRSISTQIQKLRRK
jgi:hypothetical protein